MIELQIIYYLLNKDKYEKYRRYLKESESNRDYLKILDSLHKSLGRDITLEEYTTIATDYPTEEILGSLFKEDYISFALDQYKQRELAYELALLSADVAEGKKSIDDILSLVKQFERVIKAKDNYVTDDIEDICADLDAKTGIPFRLKALQNATNGLRGGDFAVFFARTNAGKTTWLASEVSHMAEHVDRPILWFNNEERGKKVKRRIIQASLGWTDEQIIVDKNKTLSNYLKKTKGLIKLKDDAFITHYDIDNLVEAEKPSLIVIDQIDKVKGFRHETRADQSLGNIYIWARELAKKYDIPVIGVTQASASGEGKAWLTTEDIADSKTSKPAEADLLVGIGKRNSEGSENLRHLNIIKNKLTGQEIRIDCRINPNIARYVDL